MYRTLPPSDTMGEGMGSWRGRVYDYLRSKIEKGEKLYFILIDPEKSVEIDNCIRLIEELVPMGLDAVLIGGSLSVTSYDVDVILEKLSRVDVPKILFPGSVAGISKNADAVLFISLLNSVDPYYIVGAQMSAAPIIRKFGLEAIPTAYIIVGYGGAAGFVGSARPVPLDKPEIAAAYALAAKYMGMKVVYLEAGSGAPRHIPGAFVKTVRKAVGEDVMIIVGGGIRSGEAAKEVLENGADAVVTGTLFEEDPSKCKEIASVVKALVR